MHLAVEAVAEQLSALFPHQPVGTVLRAVADCVAEFPDVDELFIEQVAAARLATPTGTVQVPLQPEGH